MNTGLKPGYKTTEFLVTLGTILALVLDVIPAAQRNEGKYAAWIAAAYVIARGLSKLNPPKDEAANVDNVNADPAFADERGYGLIEAVVAVLVVLILAAVLLRIL